MFRFLNFHKNHQTKGEWIFYFKDPAAGNEFERLMSARNIEFRKLNNPENPDVLYFSVANNHFEEAQNFNAAALSKSPKSFIPDKGSRYFLLAVFVFFTLLALVGYIMNQIKR